jgi:hypothetical protein
MQATENFSRHKKVHNPGKITIEQNEINNQKKYIKKMNTPYNPGIQHSAYPLK